MNLISFFFKNEVNNFVYEYWKNNRYKKIKQTLFNNYYFGYWHKINNLNITKKDIEKIIINKNLKKIKIKKITSRIKNDTAFIHIRGGDYLLKKYWKFNVCDKEYFKKALIKLNKFKKIKLYHVITNDINHAKKIIKSIELDKPVYFLKKHKLNITEEFVIQTQYKYGVISNSNFSYLPTFFSNKRVLTIAPKKEFVNKNYVKSEKLERTIYI